MDIINAERLLPNVGDTLMEVPTKEANFPGIGCSKMRPQKCRVVEVNRAHLWYRVQFENGHTECYKVPAVRDKDGRLK